ATKRGRQPIGVRTLQVPLDALRTEHPAVERNVFTWLEADDLVVQHLQLDAALLPAEAAMRFHQPLGVGAGRAAGAGRRRSVRAEPFDDAKLVDWNRRHVRYSVSAIRSLNRSLQAAACARPTSARRQRGQIC